MNRSIHRDAERDLGDAARYYKTEANPGFGTPTTTGRRVYPLRGFPYSVIYRLVGGDLRVLVVRHQSRDPKFGGERT